MSGNFEGIKTQKYGVEVAVSYTHLAQVDFGEFLRCDAEGNEHKAYELVMSFPYSDKAYAQVFPSQNQECLLIGMSRIFEYIGGVPARIRFDNMSTAVAQDVYKRQPPCIHG